MPIAAAVVVHAEKAASRIVHQIARRLVPREGFAGLLRGPRRRGVVGDGHVHDPAALVRQDHEHE